MNKIDPLFQSLASIANVIHDQAIIGRFVSKDYKKEYLNACRFSIAKLVENLKDFDDINQGEHNG